MTHPQPSAPLRSAVIGCGAISKEHLDFIAASSRADLVGVCDLSPAIADWTARKYRTDPFTVHLEMFERTAPQVVHVLTPPRSHVPLARQAIDTAAHVVVEKPMASTAAEVEALYDAADSNGLLIIENQNYRFNDGVADIRGLLDDGSLGDLTEIDVRIHKHLGETRFADPNMPNPLGHLAGGAVRDFLPHMVGLALDLAEAKTVDDVAASWRSDVGDEALGVDGLDAVFRIDAVAARMFFSSVSEPEGFLVTVRGTHGSVTVDLWQPHQMRYLRRGSETLTPLLNQLMGGSALVGSAFRGFRNKVMQHLPYHGIGRLLDEFYRAIQTGGEPPLTRTDVVLTARTVDQISSFAPQP